MSIKRYDILGNKDNVELIEHISGSHVSYKDYAKKMNTKEYQFEIERTAMMKEIDDLREQLWKPRPRYEIVNECEDLNVTIPPIKKGQKITISYG